MPTPYRRDSSVYELDAAAEKPLRLVQSLPTLGATDFKAFTISGTTFLAVSNEQDDRLGGDVEPDDRVLELVLDADAVDGVLGDVAVDGDDHRDRLADVVDLARGQHVLGAWRRQRRVRDQQRQPHALQR